MTNPLLKISPAARPWLGFGLIFLLAASLRFWNLTAESFWLDEVYSMESAMGRGFVHRLLPPDTLIARVPNYTDPSRAAPWWRIVTSCTGPTGDTHPPLGYLVLRAWCGVFGYSDFAARALPATLSLAALLLLFLTARALHGDATALWACLLMAVAQPQIEFAQEVKHYALLQALALAGALAVVRIEKQGATFRRCAALAGATLAMLFTHYFSMGVVAAIGLYALLRLRGRDRRRAVLAIAAACAVFAAAWVPAVLQQARTTTADVDFFKDRDPGFLPRELRRLALLPFRYLNEPLRGATGPAYVACVIGLLPALLVRRRPDLLLWALWLPLVILPVLAVDLLKTTWLLHMVRYTLPASAAVYAALPALTSRMRPAVRHALPAIALFSCVVALPAAYAQDKSDFRTLGKDYASLVRPGDTTVICADQDAAHLTYMRLVCLSYYAGAPPGPVALLTHPPDPALVAQLRARGIVWALGTDVDVRQILPGVEVLAEQRYSPFARLSAVRWPAPTSGTAMARGVVGELRNRQAPPP